MKQVTRLHFVAILSFFTFALISCSQDELKAPGQSVAAGRSLSNENNGTEPGHIKAIVGPQEYSISMTVSGEEFAPLTFSSAEGLIVAPNIPEGFYTVVFRATNVFAANQTSEISFQNVQVLPGEATDLGTITFE